MGNAIYEQFSPTDRSGTIAAGGTAQQLMPARSTRQGFSIQNLSDGDLWINSLGTASAAAGSLKISSGALYETPAPMKVATAVSIFGATTGQAFTAREW